LKANLDIDVLRTCLNKKLQGTIQMVTQQMDKIVQRYKLKGVFSQYAREYEYLQNLEVISEGFNFITQGEVLQAQEVFERLKNIPINDSDLAEKFYQKFEAFPAELKWLVLDVVTACSKCIYCDAMQILTTDNKYGKIDYDISIESENKR
jgi:hypothetical protein